MKNYRLLTLFLALTLAASATACGGSAPSADTTASGGASGDAATTPAVTEEAIPSLPDKDLGGFKLVLGKTPQDKVAWATVTFAASEENGEVLNDAIVKRNRDMQEKYNFQMEDIEFADPLGTMNQQIMAGDNDVDIFLVPLNKVNAIATSEYLINWYDVPNVDLTGAWWDQDMQRDLDLGDGMFFMNGDLIFSVYDCLRVVYYCKNLAEDLKLADTYGEFYDLVTDGKWTIDKLDEMKEIAAADLNGDGAMDYRDRFGIMYNHASHEGFITSQDQQLVKLIDGKPTLNVFNERFYTVYENVVNVISGVNSFHYNQDKYPGLTAREAIVSLFDNKQSLFYDNGLSAAAQYMRNIENVDFGFLPMPKFDEKQEKYYSYVSTSAPVLALPVTIPDDRLEKTGFALEALCRESSKSVVPEYFETCFSAKYTRDERSYEMIVLATESRRYDLGIIYNYGTISTVIKDAAEAGNENITSALESIRTAVEASIKDYHG